MPKAGGINAAAGGIPQGRAVIRPTLRKGSRVAIVSPASAAREDRVLAGTEALRRFGYEPVLMPHALRRGPLHYAGTAEQRAADLAAAFEDRTIQGVLCTRGGWGSAELLPLLDAAWFQQQAQAHPKVFVGYSDHSSLHTWLWNECRLPTVYGPMVAADWAPHGVSTNGVDDRTWRAVVEERGTWTAGKADGLRLLRAGQGQVEGRLLGGCLSILDQHLPPSPADS